MFRKAALAGAAALALAVVPGLARAGAPAPHVMTIRLPDGGVARIQYTGDVAPRIVFAPIATARPMPFMDTAFGPGSPFAMLQAMSAAMDREAAALMQQASMAFQAPMLPFAGGLVPAGFGHAPAGTEAYSVISSTGGQGVCMRSMTITSSGNGAAPHVVSRQSGDCGHAAGHGFAPAYQRVAPQPPARTGILTRVRYDGHGPAGLIHPIPAWQG